MKPNLVSFLFSSPDSWQREVRRLWSGKPGMGVCEPRHNSLHPVLRCPPEHGRPRQQGQVTQTGPDRARDS